MMHLRKDQEASRAKLRAALWLRTNAPNAKFSTAYMTVWGLTNKQWEEFSEQFKGWERVQK